LAPDLLLKANWYHFLTFEESTDLSYPGSEDLVKLKEAQALQRRNFRCRSETLSA